MRFSAIVCVRVPGPSTRRGDSALRSGGREGGGGGERGGRRRGGRGQLLFSFLRKQPGGRPTGRPPEVLSVYGQRGREAAGGALRPPPPVTAGRGCEMRGEPKGAARPRESERRRAREPRAATADQARTPREGGRRGRARHAAANGSQGRGRGPRGGAEGERAGQRKEGSGAARGRGRLGCAVRLFLPAAPEGRGGLRSSAAGAHR